MNQRSAELNEIISDTQRLKELEREVDRWINKAESELDVIDPNGETKVDSAKQSPRRLLRRLDANRRKRLQVFGFVFHKSVTAHQKVNNIAHQCCHHLF